MEPCPLFRAKREAGKMLRQAARQGIQASQRALSTTTARPSSQVTVADPSELSFEHKKKFYPKIGNREIVGPGFNNRANYVDRADFPCPAVRFMEPTAEILALREKEKGDWSKLTVEEKKELYRANFRETFEEMNASTGEWRSVLAAILLGMSLSGWIIIWLKLYVYAPMPETLKEEHRSKQVERMLKQRQGAVQGLSSQWDYEKGQWK